MVERVDRYVCARVCACGVCICVVGPPGGVQAFVGGWSEAQEVRIRGSHRVEHVPHKRTAL